MGSQEPQGHVQTPITVEDVLNSQMIAHPFACCLNLPIA
jgi:hypothetical protein